MATEHQAATHLDNICVVYSGFAKMKGFLILLGLFLFHSPQNECDIEPIGEASVILASCLVLQ